MHPFMISVEEAIRLIQLNSAPAPAIDTALAKAGNKTLAEDIYSTADIPAFPQSSMDGYAFSFQDLSPNESLTIFGEVAAGSNDPFDLPTGYATRIFTGAPVPTGADTVVMQEKCHVENGQLFINDTLLKAGQNVRAIGSEIKNKSLALNKGTLLSAAAIGFLAGIGRSFVSVYPSPVVSLILTGNELQQPGRVLGYGQVYESNSFALSAALQRANIPVSEIFTVEDDIDKLCNALSTALQQSDLILLTGGVSVGDYDFTLKAAERCGVETVFHKIKQKPGKPLFFGKKGEKLIFGLPGNPSSVLTCFYEYVLEAISILQSRNVCLSKKQYAITNTYTKPAGITHFLKGIIQGDEVLALDGQESYKMNSFAKADCLIAVSEQVTQLQPGDLVSVHLLPL
jgi:molybdopterin molybdotransferase